MRYAISFFIILAIGMAGTVCQAYTLHRGRSDGLGGAAILSDAAAATLVAVPCGGIDDGALKIETGFSRRFGMKELDHVFAAAAGRKSRFVYGVGLMQFGSADFYAEQTGVLSAAYRYDSLTVGVSASILSVQFGTLYERLTSTSFTVGGGYRRGRILAAIVADNLTSPRLHENGPKTKPTFTGYFELMGERYYSVVARCRVQETERPQFGLGQKVAISAAGSLFWGVGTAPLTYGGGLDINYRHGRISYAASYHPIFGLSHTLSFAYTVGK
jgi:hypothetical protein